VKFAPSAPPAAKQRTTAALGGHASWLTRSALLHRGTSNLPQASESATVTNLVHVVWDRRHTTKTAVSFLALASPS
jgi:hypothetical protein